MPVNTQGAPISQAPGSPVTPVAPSAPVNPTQTQLDARTAALSPTVTAAPTPAPQTSTPASTDTQPASEPTVLASGNITDSVIPANTDALNGLANKGSYVGPDGQTYHADGTLAPPAEQPAAPPIPAGATDNGNGTYTLGGLTYDNPAADPETAAINSTIALLKGSLDASTKQSVDAIEQQYQQLIAQQTSANTAQGASRSAALLAGGTSRYSPMTAAGITNTQVSYGLQQIQKLDADENAAIAQANQAQASGDSQLADKLIAQAQSIRTAKQNAATKLSDTLSTANTKALAQQQQSSIDTGIASLLSSGVTDPAQILQALAANGMDATAAQVSASLTSFLTSSGAGNLKNLTGDVKNFTALQQQGTLPASILALPSEQQLAAYIAMVHAADKGTLATALANAGGLSTGAGGDPVATDASGNAISVDMDADGNPDPQAQATFLASLPGGAGGGVATLVQGLADYSINPAAFTTRNYAGATGMTQSQVLSLVKQYDPSYDEKQYASASAMQKNVSSGTYSQTITAANTLVSHLQDLQQALNDLYTPSGGDLNASGLLAGLNNKTVVALQGLGGGNASVKSFNTFAQAVAEEAAKIYKGTASPSEGEINQWASTLSPTNSLAANQAAITAILKLMGGKLSTISQQYKQALGNTQGLQILTPSSAAILKSMGLDPNDYDPTYDGNQDDSHNGVQMPGLTSDSGSGTFNGINLPN